jgi:hypothetical protein
VLQALQSTRVLCSKGDESPTPTFAQCSKAWGFLPDQASMAAIAFSDVVVSHEQFSNGLLFHELVQVEQYRPLGIPRFSELYVHRFLNGGSYEAIPLEVNAYSLEDRCRGQSSHRSRPRCWARPRHTRLTHPLPGLWLVAPKGRQMVLRVRTLVEYH